MTPSEAVETCARKRSIQSLKFGGAEVSGKGGSQQRFITPMSLQPINRSPFYQWGSLLLLSEINLCLSEQNSNASLFLPRCIRDQRSPSKKRRGPPHLRLVMTMIILFAASWAMVNLLIGSRSLNSSLLSQLIENLGPPAIRNGLHEGRAQIKHCIEYCRCLISDERGALCSLVLFLRPLTFARTIQASSFREQFMVQVQRAFIKGENRRGSRSEFLTRSLSH